MTVATRFAPSPTGPLHLGHAFSALTADDFARRHGGSFLLRLEDIDRSRSKPEWAKEIERDLTWLGVTWDGPVLRQAPRLGAYRAAIDGLWARGLLYSCTCTRADIAAALSAPQEGAVPVGPDGLVYPGTCREGCRTGSTPDGVLRLDMRAALDLVGGGMWYVELGGGARDRIAVTREHLVEQAGDVVLARRDMGTSYHLSVVLDDHAQGITHVVRGRDLAEATAIHVLLQRLLGCRTPAYLHHSLIRDASGKRLAKRHDARAIREYRSRGASPADIRRMVGLDQPSAGTSRPSRTAV